MAPVGAWSGALQPQGGGHSVGAAVTRATHIHTPGSQKPGVGRETPLQLPPGRAHP